MGSLNTSELGEVNDDPSWLASHVSKSGASDVQIVVAKRLKKIRMRGNESRKQVRDADTGERAGRILGYFF